MVVISDLTSVTYEQLEFSCEMGMHTLYQLIDGSVEVEVYDEPAQVHCLRFVAHPTIEERERYHIGHLWVLAYLSLMAHTVCR